MSPASRDLTGRRSLVEMKGQAPRVQGQEKSQAPGQIPPDQGPRHSYTLGTTLAWPFVGQKLVHQAQSQPAAGRPMAGPWRTE